MMTLIIIAEGIVMPMLLTATDAFHAPVHDCHCSVVSHGFLHTWYCLFCYCSNDRILR